MDPRIILFTGKGGVGKTTCAAATALRCAGEGLRTVVVSTDPAHSLGDALDEQLSDELKRVAPNCDARQLDARARMESSWGEIREYLREVFASAGLDEVEAEELAVIPGLDEVFALADLKSLVAANDHDVIIVDCAPTAETIRLLSLPDVIDFYMDRLFPIGRRLNKVIGPVVARLAHIPAATDEVFGATERLHRRLDGVRDLLTTERATIRLVVNPERIVVAEARRTYTYLSLFGYRVDAVVANRVLPAAVSDPFFEDWRRAQDEHLRSIEEAFSPLPILRSELSRTEVVGVGGLLDFAERLYGAQRAEGVLHDGEPMRVDMEGVTARLSLDLPNVAPGDLDLGVSGEDLVVTLGPLRRVITLPDGLRRRTVDRARMEDGRLVVDFAPSAAGTL